MNPSQPKCQLLGVANLDQMRLYSNVYQTLGIDLHPVLDATHAEVLLADDGTFYNDGGDPLSLRQMASRSGSRKVRLRNGQIVVWADGKCYDLSGRRLKLE